MTQSKTFFVRAFGDLACFSRPEMKVERVSYEVMTPSAACGLLESIHWRHAIRWEIEEIQVLNPIRWCSFRRNEVKDCASPRVPRIITDDPRQRSQRNTLALRDVDYLIKAHFKLTSQAPAQTSISVYEDIFTSRLSLGQHFYPPFFGMREMIAFVEPPERPAVPFEHGTRRSLGWMFYDFANTEGKRVIDYASGTSRRVPLFFDASLQNGVLHTPPREQILRENGLVI
jgi:CRISPR-associated protein Cas5d